MQSELIPFSPRDIHSAGSALSLVILQQQGLLSSSQSSIDKKTEEKIQSDPLPKPELRPSDFIPSHFEMSKINGGLQRQPMEEEWKGPPVCEKSMVWLWDFRTDAPNLVNAARELPVDDYLIHRRTRRHTDQQREIQKISSKFLLDELNDKPCPTATLDHYPTANLDRLEHYPNATRDRLEEDQNSVYLFNFGIPA